MARPDRRQPRAGPRRHRRLSRRITLTRLAPLTPADDRALQFNPTHLLDGIRPAIR